MDCEHCHIEKCGVLNRRECPINQLWEKARELEAKVLVAEAERIVKGGR